MSGELKCGVKQTELIFTEKETKQNLTLFNVSNVKVNFKVQCSSKGVFSFEPEGTLNSKREIDLYIYLKENSQQEIHTFLVTFTESEPVNATTIQRKKVKIQAILKFNSNTISSSQVSDKDVSKEKSTTDKAAPSDMAQHEKGTSLFVLLPLMIGAFLCQTISSSGTPYLDHYITYFVLGTA
eukprot:TRINITY_DN4288_c0_g1_i5.p1 TRINITY_DN4288_c0_g1~~TRINITY_DN4288_c0_g1_i5.p1  ORF type:complete len:190 (-),score=26.87 TRINITY_DN4288_c0_g1_i5:40-585(-)